VQGAGSVDQVLAAHKDVRDGAGDASSASSRCSTPDPLSQSPKSTVPPHGDPPPIPQSTEAVTLRNKLPAAGEFCIGPTCVGCSASKVSWFLKVSPMALQLIAQCDLQQSRI
jgi:hypothetical protein